MVKFNEWIDFRELNHLTNRLKATLLVAPLKLVALGFATNADDAAIHRPRFARDHLQ